MPDLETLLTAGPAALVTNEVAPVVLPTWFLFVMIEASLLLLVIPAAELSTGPESFAIVKLE